MSSDTAQPPTTSGSRRIENACGVTGGRSPKVFPKTRDRKERGKRTKKGADLAPMCVSGLVGPRLGLSRGCLGAVLGRLGAVLGLSWPVLGLLGAKRREDSKKVPQDRPTRHPRSPKTVRKLIPNTDLFVTFSGSVFGFLRDWFSEGFRDAWDH